MPDTSTPMTPAIFKHSSSTDRPDRPFSFHLLENASPVRFRRRSPRMLICKIQELAAAPESLAKNNEILRNKQMRAASHQETGVDFGNGEGFKLNAEIRKGFEARSRSITENVGTMEERTT